MFEQFLTTIIALGMKNFSEYFEMAMIALRKEIPGMLNLTALASTFGALFVIIRLIHLVKEIEGDDVVGGQGHVDLAEFFRPVILFCFIQIAVPLTTALDALVTPTTDAIYNRAAKVSMWQRTKNDFTKIGQEIDTNAALGFDAANKTLKEAQQTKNSKKFFQGAGDLVQSFLYKILAWWQNIASSFWKALGNIALWVCSIVYDITGSMFLVIANINLCIVEIFLPFVLAFSILKPWENAWLKVVANWIFFCLWRPLIRVVQMIIGAMMSVIDSIGAKDIVTQSNVVTSIANAFGANGFASSILTIIAFLMGIFAIMQVPSLANTALSLGSTGDTNGSDPIRRTLKMIPGVGNFM